MDKVHYIILLGEFRTLLVREREFRLLRNMHKITVDALPNTSDGKFMLEPLASIANTGKLRGVTIICGLPVFPLESEFMH